MFNKARIKLTLWYLLIVMVISLSFSFVIYRASANEIERFDRMQRVRIESRFGFPPVVVIDRSLIEETERRIVVTLIFINTTIFIVSGLTGYFLAGRTLNPISVMIDEQNRFISDASHEINTPLTSLKTAMEVYLRAKNKRLDEANLLVSESIEEVNKLQQLSTSLLQLASYQKPQDQIKFEKVSVKEVVAMAILETKPLAQKKLIAIKENVSNFKITGDKDSLINLFVILLDNAIKYSNEKGEVVISTHKRDGYVVMNVSDNGSGIKKADIPYIFDRFYRADSARSKKTTGGYGLGLAIAKRIVETHQGIIKVNSTLGKGTTFRVYLPHA